MLAEGDPESINCGDEVHFLLPSRDGRWMSSVKYPDFSDVCFQIGELSVMRYTALTAVILVWKHRVIIDLGNSILL